MEEYYYIMFYGYKDLIPANLPKIAYNSKYLFINNDFEKLENINKNKALYIYFFGEKYDYTVEYINTYKLNASSFYTKITPKDNYYLIPELNYVDGYYSTYYSNAYVELYFCRNDLESNPMNMEITLPSGSVSNKYIKTRY